MNKKNFTPEAQVPQEIKEGKNLVGKTVTLKEGPTVKIFDELEGADATKRFRVFRGTDIKGKKGDKEPYYYQIVTDQDLKIVSWEKYEKQIAKDER